MFICIFSDPSKALNCVSIISLTLYLNKDFKGFLPIKKKDNVDKKHRAKVNMFGLML